MNQGGADKTNGARADGGDGVPCTTRIHAGFRAVHNKTHIVPMVTDEEARKIYPDGFKTVKPYLRTVKQPV